MTQMPDSLVAPGHVYYQECHLACRFSLWDGLLLSINLSVFILSIELLFFSTRCTLMRVLFVFQGL